MRNCHSKWMPNLLLHKILVRVFRCIAEILSIENLKKDDKNLISGTLNVASLDTNIPNEEELICIKDVLDKERNIPEKNSNESLLNLL